MEAKKLLRSTWNKGLLIFAPKGEGCIRFIGTSAGHGYRVGAEVARLVLPVTERGVLACSVWTGGEWHDAIVPLMPRWHGWGYTMGGGYFITHPGQYVSVREHRYLVLDTGHSGCYSSLGVPFAHPDLICRYLVGRATVADLAACSGAWQAEQEREQLFQAFGVLWPLLGALMPGEETGQTPEQRAKAILTSLHRRLEALDRQQDMLDEALASMPGALEQIEFVRLLLEILERIGLYESIWGCSEQALAALLQRIEQVTSASPLSGYRYN